jgi:hypothetical protein
LAFRKVGAIPAKADPPEQRRFLDEQLQPRLQEAQEGRREVWFVDAAHLLYATILGYRWCFARLFVRAAAGRQRFNIIGALNAVTKQIVGVNTTTKVHRHTLVQLLMKLVPVLPNGFPTVPTIPITLVLDNARYNRARFVKSMAEFLGIELLYLPTYSPNLNLIERLWKHLRKELFSCTDYPTFAQFCTAVERCLEEANTVRQAQIQSLCALKFQMFDDVPTVAA